MKESFVEGTMIFGPEKDNQVDNDLLILESVCVQHEIDHLNGLTIYDREYKLEQYIRTEKNMVETKRLPFQKEKKP